MKVYIDLLVNQYQIDNLVVNKLLKPISTDKQLIVDKAEEILQEWYPYDEIELEISARWINDFRIYNP